MIKKKNCVMLRIICPKEGFDSKNKIKTNHPISDEEFLKDIRPKILEYAMEIAGLSDSEKLSVEIKY